MIGRSLLHYQILDKLGQGGMGEVYRARDTRLNRLVAVKVLKTEGDTGNEAQRRFLNEAQAASALNHPHIVTIHADPAGFGGARIVNWRARYFLINGRSHPDTPHIAFTTGADVLLRMVNAGLTTVVPTLEGGLYASLVAEDGNRYPHPMSQYGVELPAAKTVDAMVRVTSEGTYALYDRALRLTTQGATSGGMLTSLDVASTAGVLEHGAAAPSVAESGATPTVTVNRVGGSAGPVSVDYATADGTATAAGADYTAVPATTLNFADLQTSATFDIAILDDAATPVYEGSETFTSNIRRRAAESSLPVIV